MLDIIRANAQSWGVKVAFGIIIIVFVFWGVGGLTGDSTTVVLMVNDEPISYQQFQRHYTMVEENLRQQQPELTREMLKEMQFGRQVQQQLVLNMVLQQEARRAGITVSPLELRHRIESFPYFRNSEGKFDPDLYLRMLEARRETPGRFEADVSREILTEKLQQDVTAGAFVSEQEVRELFQYDSERRVLEYVLFPLSDFTGKATLEPDATKVYYDAHQDEFRIPPMANVDYMLVSPATLAVAFPVTDEAVKHFYDQNPARYAQPAQVKARHILIPVSENAPDADRQKAESTIADLTKRLQAGEDFAALAREFSQDPGSAPQGGDLGWFEKGTMVPAFADAAFALKKGERSKPVRTQFGYHLIQVDDIRPAATLPLQEVQQAIRLQLSSEQAAGKLQDALDQILLAVIGGKGLAETGASHKLEVKSTGMLDAAALGTALGIKPQDVQILLGMKQGAVTDTPFVTKEGYVVAKVTEKKSESVKPLADVSAGIETRLRTEKTRDMAMQAATAARADMKDGTLAPALMSKLKKSTPLSRRGGLAELGDNPDLTRATFEADMNEWLPTAYALNDGVLLGRVVDKVLPDDATWTQVKEPLTQAVLNAKREQMFRAFVNMLMAQAKIEVRNEAVLNQ